MFFLLLNLPSFSSVLGIEKPPILFNFSNFANNSEFRLLSVGQQKKTEKKTIFPRVLYYFLQASVPGPGDALPPGRSCLFGWDQPCPAEERAQGVLNLSLVLAPEPLSSPEGKRQAKTLNIRRLGERTSLATSRGRYVCICV